jgi:hypothetical protein
MMFLTTLPLWLSGILVIGPDPHCHGRSGRSSPRAQTPD